MQALNGYHAAARTRRGKFQTNVGDMSELDVIAGKSYRVLWLRLIDYKLASRPGTLAFWRCLLR